MESPAFAGLFPYVSAVLRRKRKFSIFFILELTERREIAIILKLYDSLAQLAEHLTFNQGVRGSNPRWITKNPHSLEWGFLLLSLTFHIYFMSVGL